jgi:acetyltransferase-like isoleucine patch superfamily enzyme
VRGPIHQCSVNTITDYFTLLLLIKVSGVSSDCEMSGGRSSLFWLYIAVKYFVYSEYVAFSFPEIPTIPDFSFDLATAGTSALHDRVNEFCSQHDVHPALVVLRRAEKLAYEIDQEQFREYVGVLPEDITYFVHSANCPLLRAKAGKGTYGMQHISHAYNGEDNSGLTIGRYVQIAKNLRLMLGYNHCYKRAALYPFESLNLPFRNASGLYSTSIFETRFCPYSNGPITIGNDVWIAEDVAILSGVTVGDGAILGFGAVVREDVPPYAIVMGNPAKIMKYRHNPDQIQKLLDIRWWDWSDARILTNMELLLDSDVNRFIEANWQRDGNENLNYEVF